MYRVHNQTPSNTVFEVQGDVPQQWNRASVGPAVNSTPQSPAPFYVGHIAAFTNQPVRQEQQNPFQQSLHNRTQSQGSSGLPMS